MKGCPGGLRWWVVGVGNGDVDGFLDGRKFEGGMDEPEFVEICAVTSEGILTKETKAKEEELDDDDDDAYEDEDDLEDDLDDEEEEDIVILRGRGGHRHHRRHHRHHHRHQKKYYHHRHNNSKPSGSDADLETFVTKELVRRSKSPLRHYIRQVREESEAEADENDLWLQGNVSVPPKPKEKPKAWTIPTEGDEDGEIDEGGKTVDREAEAEAQDFIRDVLEEDVPQGHKEGGAPARVPVSNVPGQPTTAQLKALRHTFESADGTSHYNGSITGTCHPRVFIRTCQSILQWTPGEEEVRMLMAKGGGVCYRVFLRDPVGWGYNIGFTALAGATARMVAEKARGEVRVCDVRVA